MQSNELSTPGRPALAAPALASQLAQAQRDQESLTLALQAAEEQATSVFRLAPCVMVITTFDGFIIRDVNDAFVQASGYSREAVVGRTTREFPWWPSAEVRDQLLAALERDGEVSNLETRFMSRAGEEVVTLLNARRITLRGEECVLTHTSDITARARAEASRQALEQEQRQKERLESLGLVAGGIAHDFNNLLVSILGNAELLLAIAPGSASWRQPLQAIVASAEHAAEHTRELLDYAGRGAGRPTRVELGELLAEVTGLAAPHAPRGLSVHYQRPAQQVWVQVDRGQVTRMLLNLLKNGLEAMGLADGHVLVTLDTERGPGLGSAVLRVRDQGAGMDAQTCARIFDPFFSTKQAGHGLGLASVRSIVQRHEGTIEVDTAEGSGSTFTVKLPLSAPPEPDATTPPVLTSPPPRRARILVVDDEVSVRETACALLAELGYSVEEAGDGAGAIAKVQTSEPFDIVLLDATMPGLDAFQTLRGLRAAAPTLPVLLCSGYSRDDFARELENDTRLDFLAKPYRVAELLRVLSKLMQ